MINYGYHTHFPIVSLNSTNLSKTESVKIESWFRECRLVRVSPEELSKDWLFATKSTKKEITGRQ